MLQLRERIGLAVKILDRPRPFFGVGEPIKDLFDGTAAVSQTLILGNVDQPHSSTGEKAGDAVASGQHRAGFELSTLITGHGRCPRYSCNTTTTEILSLPPPALAATTNSSAASPG